VPAFSKILIANRGEIVVRVARTARSLGYRTVAVYSEADKASPHVAACDEALCIGPAPAAQSYLSIEAILGAAKRTGADAIHPGYGFLSENAAFAQACADAGIVFVGPPAGAIRAMGNKASAKALMLEAGVPCLESFSGEQTSAAFRVAASGIGYPVMLKAAAGGGGKGMRVVRSEAELAAAFDSTRLEAERAFGSGQMLMERALEGARHIEIQIFADGYGSIVHLGERDCSIQRRHQKVVEEAPAPAVTPALREAMGAAAIAAARSVGYAGAGTVEFLLDDDGTFSFLEMNTRLQVEHAVTEAVTGIDLVAWQLRVAAGARLETLRPSVPAAAHAIEVRLYAEDPAQGFLPQAGRIAAWVPPCAEGVRVDAALCEGLEVSPYYDPMLAKIIASGSDREEARRRLVAALEDLVLFGIASNRRFLIGVLDDPAFVSGDARTNFLEGALPSTTAGSETAGMARALAAALFYFGAERERAGGTWRSGRTLPVTLKLRDSKATIDASLRITGTFAADVMLAGVTQAIEILARSAHAVRFVHNGVTRTARTALDGTTLHLQLGRDEFAFGDATFLAPLEATTAARGSATSPMPGIVAAVPVAVGDEVVRGQTVVVLEAMKMMHEIAAGASGRVTSVLVVPGQQVGMRAPLVEIVSVE
jgi:geranyl-CoA carboxylase alpha subunit